MSKLILKIGKLKTIVSDQDFELEDVNTGELIEASFSINTKKRPEFIIGKRYDIVVSPYEPYRGRIIISRKNYDLDYSNIE